MTLVIDASVAVKWVLEEEGSAQARRLLDQPLVAPDLWLSEAADTLWKRALTGEITPEQSHEALSILLSAPVKTVPAAGDAAAALRLAIALRQPAYGCFYLAAALRLDGEVVTADTRFVRAAAQTVHARRVRPLIA